MKRTFTPWRIWCLVMLPLLAGMLMMLLVSMTDPWMFHFDWTRDGVMVAPSPHR